MGLSSARVSCYGKATGGGATPPASRGWFYAIKERLSSWLLVPKNALSRRTCPLFPTKRRLRSALPLQCLVDFGLGGAFPRMSSSNFAFISV